MPETESMLVAKEFAFKLYEINLKLGGWAMELAVAGLTEDEIKALLHAAMEKAGRD